MATNTLKLKDIDTGLFLEYLKDADIDHPQTIDFLSDQVTCRAHPSNKTVVKYTSVPSKIFTYEDIPTGFSLLKLPLYRLKKLKDVLSIYIASGAEKINATIGYQIASDKSFVANYIEFSGGSQKVRIKAAEVLLVPYMEPNKWTILSNTDNYIVRYDMSKAMIARLIKLMKIRMGGDDNEKNKTKVIAYVIKYSKTSNQFSLSSMENGEWEIVYTSEFGNIDIKATEDFMFRVPKDVLEKMKNELYTVHVVYNEIAKQTVMITKENDNSIFVNSLQVFDPNARSQ